MDTPSSVGSLDHPSPAGLLIRSGAGLLGAAGVALAAAGAHIGGGNLVSTAASFAMIHAAVALALSVLGSKLRGDTIVSAWLLLGGTLLFSGDLALAGLADLRPWPTAAPLGGFMMIAGWLLLPVGALAQAMWPSRT